MTWLVASEHQRRLIAMYRSSCVSLLTYSWCVLRAPLSLQVPDAKDEFNFPQAATPGIHIGCLNGPSLTGYCCWSLLRAPLQTQGGDTAGDGTAQDAGLGGATGTGSVVVGSSKKGRAGRPDVWHRHNAIFVLNPSKVRVQPTAASAVTCNMLHVFVVCVRDAAGRAEMLL